MRHSRIYIVAGPRACGKSTFIERCIADASDLVLPAEIAGLAQAQGPVYFMELANRELGDRGLGTAGDWLIHVDLLTPFADLAVVSEVELVSQIHPDAFAAFPGASLFAECEALQVLTLRVPRTTALRRGIRRVAQQGRRSVGAAMAMLYSDATGESGYSALYDAWDSYVAGLPQARTWDVLESPDGRSYSIRQNP